LLSQLGLNCLFAQKLAYYSSGISAVTLFNNYVILDPATNRLTVGYNLPCFAKLTNAVKGVSSIALQTNTVKGVTNLFQGGKWQNEIGIRVRHTFGMNQGRIWYDPAQRVKQQRALRPEVALAYADKSLQLADYTRLLDQAYGSLRDTVGRGEKLRTFQKEVQKAYAERVTAFEVAKTDYNVLFTYWFSVFGYLPLTTSTATVSDQPREFKPYEFGGQANFLLETNYVNVFANLSVSHLANDNNTTLHEAFGDLADSKDTNDIKTVNRVLGVALAKGVYTGSYQLFETWHINPQVVLSSPWLAEKLATSKSVRNVSLEMFADFQRGKYKVANGGFGLLFSLFVNKDKPLNTELIFKYRDIDNAFLPDVPASRKSMIGFRMTLPFNSIIY
jgi:hypothetical protein